MQNLARKLNLTPTEASRQLQRLSKAKLIERTPEGTYTTTQFAKLVLHLISPIDFSFKNKLYFLKHDVWKLPASYINRLGELSESELIVELPLAMLRWEKMFKTAEEFVWVMTPQVMPNFSLMMKDKLQAGVKLKSLIYENPNPSLKSYIYTGPNIERKTLPNIPVAIIVTEKEASICLPHLDGEMVTHAFFGSDSTFIKWVKELYQYFWGGAEACFP